MFSNSNKIFKQGGNYVDSLYAFTLVQYTVLLIYIKLLFTCIINWFLAVSDKFGLRQSIGSISIWLFIDLVYLNQDKNKTIGSYIIS